MPERVYIETTIPSYLASRPGRDLLQAARQRITHEWWAARRFQYDLCVSRIVLDEVSVGDSDAAQRRLSFLDHVPLLDLTTEVDSIASSIMQSGLLPPSAVRDAIHIAVSAVHAVDYLLTWNCRHIANATIIKELHGVVSSHGRELPVLCTPEQLLGE
jgi:hypothetical protein